MLKRNIASISSEFFPFCIGKALNRTYHVVKETNFKNIKCFGYDVLKIIVCDTINQNCMPQICDNFPGNKFVITSQVINLW